MYDIDQEVDQMLENFKKPKKAILYKNKLDKSKLVENLMILLFVFVMGLLFSGLSFWVGFVCSLIVAFSLTWREIDKEIEIKD